MKIIKAKILAIGLFLAIININQVSAQEPYFHKADLIKTGVYYYPEQWDKSQWDRDLKKMADMGFEYTHMAEFAWARLEPEEGKFDFDWLDEAVNIAGRHGLKVIMCTPTATPPLWLTKKYPEVLLVKENGLTATHGGRQFFSWSSAKYRELTERIVTAMARHYANNPNIMGWQIDNEPSHYGEEDFGNEVKAHFQQWLKAKYQTVEELNRAWGTMFWSITYPSFEDVALPNQKTNIAEVDPHELLDFRRFNAEECADFVRFNARLLKKNIPLSQWVTTNFMHFHDRVDPWLNDKDLDFITYTMYPVGGGYTNVGGLGNQGFRIGLPSRMAFPNDFFRYKKDFTGVMELQPGQVNWGLYNPQPYPGVIRAWLWNSYVGGCSIACSYRFRQPLYGGEQYHNAMIGPDGVTPSVGGLEYSKFMSEIKLLRKNFSPNTPVPANYASRKVAILWNFDNYWDTQIQPQTDQWNPEKIIFKYHAALKALGCKVDFVSEDMDISGYKMVVMPMYQLLDEKLITKLTQYVQAGGNLVLTPRTGQKDRNGHLWEQAYSNMIKPLTGARVLFYDVLPVNVNGSVTLDDKSYNWKDWADVLEPQPGTETLARYTNQYYKNKVAATLRKWGTGSVTYIGPDTDDGKLEKDIIKKVCVYAKIKAVELPEGMILDWRDGFWVAINYHSEKTLTVPIPANAKVIFGQRELKPAEVVVWTE